MKVVETVRRPHAKAVMRIEHLSRLLVGPCAVAPMGHPESQKLALLDMLEWGEVLCPW